MIIIIFTDCPDRWRKLLSKQNPDLGACVDWNIEAARTGKLPNSVPDEESTAKHEFGPLHLVGAVDGCQGQMRIIREYWDPSLDQDAYRTLWSLPEDTTGAARHIAATSTEYHPCHNEELRDNRPVPLMRYRAETRKNCETASHPNNTRQGDGQWQRGNSNTSAAASHGWTFECDIRKARAGELCLGVAKGIKENGVEDKERHYIWVGKIKGVDIDKKTVRVAELMPSKNPWEKDNIAKCKWRGGGGSSAEEDIDSKSVISYFKKMKNDLCLPLPQVRLVNNHAMWSVESSAGTDDDASQQSEASEFDSDDS